MTQQNKLKKIENILKLVDESITRQEFVSAFENVVKTIKAIEVKHELLRQQLTLENSRLRKELEKKDNTSKATLTSEVKKETSNAISQIENKLKQIKDGKDGRDGKDGKDADEEAVADIVVKKIEIPKIEDLSDSLPQLGTKIRDGLELLTGDERLEIEAIKDLEERLKEIEERAVRLGGKGGGGTSDLGVKFALSRIIRTETPSGTINGTNKVFTTTVSISSVLSFSINGMAINDDEYTLSGNTITFADAIPADLSGKSFRIKYI